MVVPGGNHGGRGGEGLQARVLPAAQAGWQSRGGTGQAAWSRAGSAVAPFVSRFARLAGTTFARVAARTHTRPHAAWLLLLAHGSPALFAPRPGLLSCMACRSGTAGCPRPNCCSLYSWLPRLACTGRAGHGSRPGRWPLWGAAGLGGQAGSERPGRVLGTYQLRTHRCTVGWVGQRGGVETGVWERGPKPCRRGRERVHGAGFQLRQLAPSWRVAGTPWLQHAASLQPPPHTEPCTAARPAQAAGPAAVHREAHVSQVDAEVKVIACGRIVGIEVAPAPAVNTASGHAGGPDAPCMLCLPC